jgi:hypothetical protein
MDRRTYKTARPHTEENREVGEKNENTRRQ